MVTQKSNRGTTVTFAVALAPTPEAVKSPRYDLALTARCDRLMPPQVLPPGYDGPVPEGGYFVTRSRTNRLRS